MSVRLENVTVAFQKNVKALDDVSFTIPSGVYGLLGENRSGKNNTHAGAGNTVKTPHPGMY